MSRSDLFDITGQTFGQWKAVRRIIDNNTGYWILRCEQCGSEGRGQSYSLRGGITPRCWICRPVSEKHIKRMAMAKAAGDPEKIAQVRERYGIREKRIPDEKRTQRLEYNTAYQRWKRTGDESALIAVREKYGIKKQSKVR